MGVQASDAVTRTEATSFYPHLSPNGDNMTITALEEVVTGEIVRTRAEWSEIIRDDMARTAESIVSTGRHLIAAKADVGHGDWLPMLREIGMSHTTAKELMAVGENAAISNGRNCDHLPGSTRALYELSRLAPEVIESGIESGDVHPGMTIKDAKGYAAEVADRAAPANVNTDTGEIDPEPEVPEKPKRDRAREKREWSADAANGLRNDLTAFANGFVALNEAIAANIAGDRHPNAALDHIADAIRDQLDRITTACNAAITATEGAKK